MEKITEIEAGKGNPVDSHTYPKLSLLQCLGLGAGGIPDAGMQAGMKSMANPIFNLIYGVNPFLIGIAFSLPRFLEIVIDPWIGGVSDRTRGPMGRRHPYMIWGGVFGFLTFALVWFVPQWMSPAMAGAWLIAFALAHFTAYSFFMVPYSALLGEVSTVPTERLKAMSFKQAFSSIAGFFMGWLYWFCQRDAFSSPAEGMKILGIGFGLLLLIGAVLPVFVCKENRKYHAIAEKGEERIKIFPALKKLWVLKSFRGILIAVFCQVSSTFLVSNLGFYIWLCFVFHGDTKAVAVLMGTCATVNLGAVLLSCGAINYCARQWGERTALYFSIGIAVLGSILNFWAAQPAHPYWILFTAALSGFGATGYWTIMSSLTGELSREHEVATGESIYGLFYAMYGMAIKIGASVGLLFTGVVLNLTGYHSSHGANQSETTIFLMRLLNMAGPTIGMLTGMFCIYCSLNHRASPRARIG